MRCFFQLSLFITLLFCFSILAQADYGYDHDRAKLLRDTGKILPLQVILEKSRKILQEGRILEVELESKGDLLLYEIELLLPNGQVVELYFDAKNGNYLLTE
jgi:uncharacterized membrane protein YkoI